MMGRVGLGRTKCLPTGSPVEWMATRPEFKMSPQGRDTVNKTTLRSLVCRDRVVPAMATTSCREDGGEVVRYAFIVSHKFSQPGFL